MLELSYRLQTLHDDFYKFLHLFVKTETKTNYYYSVLNHTPATKLEAQNASFIEDTKKKGKIA